MVTLTEYANFKTLSQTLAQKWLNVIQRTPIDQPCSFALAGGTTPEPLYRELDALFSTAKSRSIQLVATDERWVPNSDPQSNEGLFQRCFAQSKEKWELVSLKNNQPHPSSAVADIDLRLHKRVNHPFSAVILGMGADGHIASLFPNAPELLINDPLITCVAAVHPQTGQARMSLSFSRLLNTNAIWLVITGAEKRAVLEHASATSPIGALIAAASCEVLVFWCP